ncbi:MAG TPA: YitT family protein [Puia sp.]|jgi:uncharacterized membrane-anchored protein YitT (DUF2179 family)|nr:YitT family protein [Puia sp.]
MSNANTPYPGEKKFPQKKIFTVRLVKDILLLTAGVFSAGFGLESFLLPNKFIDGGATGISLLIAEVAKWPLAIILIIINIPFVILGFRQIGKSFSIKTIFGILALAICITFIHFPIVTTDKLLVSVFGGFFLGAGIGLAMRAGGVLDGTEVLAIFLSRKLSVSVGDIIIAINIFVFAIGAYVLSVEAALYSMLTYLSASKTIDFIIEGIEEYTGVTIISPKSQEIYDAVTKKLGRGITVYKGDAGFGKKGHTTDMNILFTVITRLEISKLKTEIDEIDPGAFIIMHSIKDTKGGMIKKRRLAH